MKKIYIYLTIGISLVLASIFFFTLKEEETPQVPIIEEVKASNETEEKILPSRAEIKGMVKNPGVYEFSENDRVINLIEKAGGLLKNANTSAINLSKLLTDEMVVIIYSNEEIEEVKKNNATKYEIIEIPCVCPDSTNDACIENKEEEVKLININTATKEELMTLSNIGESKAESIIQYRENFKFKTIEQLKEVSGIGESLFEKINITV